MVIAASAYVSELFSISMKKTKKTIIEVECQHTSLVLIASQDKIFLIWILTQ